MNKHILIALSFLLSLFLYQINVSSDSNEENQSWRSNDCGLKLEIKADKNMYSPLQPISITCTLENNSGKIIDLNVLKQLISVTFLPSVLSHILTFTLNSTFPQTSDLTIGQLRFKYKLHSLYKPSV